MLLYHVLVIIILNIKYRLSPPNRATLEHSKNQLANIPLEFKFLLYITVKVLIL